MKEKTIKNRWVAFSIHLAISLLLFIGLAAIIKFLWYPGILFNAEGGLEGIKLIAGVDLVIGPLLTLIVYNHKKKELKRDLTIIGFLQVFCLAGGMYIVEQNRPIAIIYGNDTFYTATRRQYENYNIDINDVALLKNRDWPSPISLDLPNDPAKRKAEATQLILTSDIRVNVEKYLTLESDLNRLLSEGMSQADAQKKGVLIPEKYKDNSNFRIFYLSTRYDLYHILVDIRSGSLVEKL